MLQLVNALVLIAALCEPPPASEPKNQECIDHSGKKVASPDKAPACWPDLAREIENGNRLAGRVASLPPDLRKAPIETPRVTFKLCIGETGDVEKVLKLLSSGNAEVDAFYCKQFRQWRFRPKKAKGIVVPSVELVTVTLYR